uniref:Sodium/nucleoside cotransporter n=1 Tax=Macrostomum lignano TaxID=282301 RepID=A0A1I8GPY4_9PLAT
AKRQQRRPRCHQATGARNWKPDGRIPYSNAAMSGHIANSKAFENVTIPVDAASCATANTVELQLAVLKDPAAEATTGAKGGNEVTEKVHEQAEIDLDAHEDFEELPPRDDCWHRLCWLTAAAAALAFLAYLAYCSFLLATRFRGTPEAEQSIRLLWVSALAILLAVVSWAPRCCRPSLERAAAQLKQLRSRCDRLFQLASTFWWVPEAFIAASFLVWMAVQNPANITSACGLLLLLLLSLAVSAHPERVNWKPVLGGILIQLVFAVLILRTRAGFLFFNFLGDRTSEFLEHCAAGSKFLFGGDYEHHFFAFKILPIIVFFSSVLTVLFHLGALQAVICRIGAFMQTVMGTTAAESMVASANIFVGQTEAPLMVRPFLPLMTKSEIHSVMTSGFATIAGGVLAAYISMGVPARHLLSASVMSAPAALAVSKLVYPETRKSRTRVEDVRRLKLARYRGIVEAAGAGAIASLSVIGAIAANLIAFVSILAFINSTVTWLGYRAGLSFPLTFEFVLSFLFWPLALVMGVPPRDCRQVAELIGIKTFLNEFIAYQRLGDIKKNYNALSAAMGNLTEVEHSWSGTDVVFPSLNLTLPGGVLFEDKSFVIATYSLCGFSNLGSMGILIGALTAMAPSRRADIAHCGPRALVAGSIACFITACIADLVLNF